MLKLQSIQVLTNPAWELGGVADHVFSTDTLNDDDSTDPAKILAWIKEYVNLEKDRAVFYSDKSVGYLAGGYYAKNEEDSYEDHRSVLDDDFSGAFGGANFEDRVTAKAYFQAFAQFAEGQTCVFNNDGDEFRIFTDPQWIQISHSNSASTPRTKSIVSRSRAYVFIGKLATRKHR